MRKKKDVVSVVVDVATAVAADIVAADIAAAVVVFSVVFAAVVTAAAFVLQKDRLDKIRREKEQLEHEQQSMGGYKRIYPSNDWAKDRLYKALLKSASAITLIGMYVCMWQPQEENKHIA